MLTDLLKTAVKFGLKSAAPILGTLGSELASTAATKLVDRASDAALKDLHHRIFQSVSDHLADALGTEHDIGNISEVVAVTAQDVLGSAETSLRCWSISAFDPKAAASSAIAEADVLLRDLNDLERTRCRHVVEAFFRALTKEREAIEKTELLFRQQILGSLDDLKDVTASLSEDLRREVDALVATAVLRVPIQQWSTEYSPPGALLRADIDDPVPFHGRENEIEDFANWCNEDRDLAVRVITGPGGIGKSRFMIEMCKRQSARGWQAGFLDSRLSVDLPGAWSALLAEQRPQVIAIDYAETRREQVTELVARIITDARPTKARIVLLARSADDWWDELKRQPAGVGDLLTGPASQIQRLSALTLSDKERRDSYWIALTHFSGKLKKSATGNPPEDLDQPHYEQTLILQMAALAAVEGIPVKGDQGILDYVLQRERRFWASHASAREIPAYMEAAIAQFMAAITLFGGSPSEIDALELASKLPLLADQSRAMQQSVSDLLHDIYPGELWIEPVLPDLLGEHLCQKELEGNADEFFDLILGAAEPAP